MNKQLPYRPAAGESLATGGISTQPARRTGIILLILLMALTIMAASGARLAHAKDFTPPAMDDFMLHSERDADGDGDGVNETHIMQYVNQQGDSLFSMTTHGRLWAWSLDTHASDSAPSNYVIRDSDCDGGFDEVYGLNDEFHVPDCVKK